MTKKAYEDGYADGLAWDIDAFDDHDDVVRDRTGWDEATISAVGSDQCAKNWGVQPDSAEWERACEEYNRGAYAGVTAPQELRTGKPTRDECLCDSCWVARNR